MPPSGLNRGLESTKLNLPALWFTFLLSKSKRGLGTWVSHFRIPGAETAMVIILGSGGSGKGQRFATVLRLTAAALPLPPSGATWFAIKLLTLPTAFLDLVMGEVAQTE